MEFRQSINRGEHYMLTGLKVKPGAWERRLKRLREQHKPGHVTERADRAPCENCVICSQWKIFPYRAAATGYWRRGLPWMEAVQPLAVYHLGKLELPIYIPIMKKGRRPSNGG